MWVGKVTTCSSNCGNAENGSWMLRVVEIHLSDKARKNESGDLEFEFLFGDEPGSEGAIAHDYLFQMKKKHELAVKAHKQHNKEIHH